MKLSIFFDLLYFIRKEGAFIMKKLDEKYVNISLGLVADLDERQARDIYFYGTLAYCISMPTILIITIIDIIMDNIGNTDSFTFSFTSILLCICVIALGLFVELKVRRIVNIVEVSNEYEYRTVKKSLKWLSFITGVFGMLAAFFVGLIGVITISIPIVFLVFQAFFVGIVCYFFQYFHWNKKNYHS